LRAGSVQHYSDNVWADKPVAVMGASIGKVGTARAQYHLRQVFVFLNMHALNQPEVMIGNAAERFDTRGNLKDEAARDLIRQSRESDAAVAELVRLGCQGGFQIRPYPSL
jgi:chromate reductase, NAD(P)H dehydrogenase (quinone)